jgi:hypothetical protein
LQAGGGEEGGGGVLERRHGAHGAPDRHIMKMLLVG